MIVDPKAGVRRACARALLDEGAEVLTAETLAEGALLVSRREPVVLVVEAELAVVAFGEAGTAARAFLERATPIVLLDVTRAAELEAEVRALAFALLERTGGAPLGLALLVERAAEQALRARSGEGRMAGALVASSRAMRDIVARIPSMADASTSVLLLGEPGVGKRALARLVHESGTRRQRPFVTLGLLETKASAFEASLSAAVESAAQGTLLLDRVDVLDAAAQAALSRALRERDFVCRVLATSLPAMRDRERSGDFLRELYMRLSTHALDVPRLADRPDDIAVLSQIFARRAAERLGLAPRRLSAEALRVLRGAPWPGNIPELEARVEAAVAGGGTGSIAIGELGFARARAGAPEAVEPYAEAKERTVSDFDREYIEQVLAFCGGNVTRAAHLAGMDRANFRRLMKRARARG